MHIYVHVNYTTIVLPTRFNSWKFHVWRTYVVFYWIIIYYDGIICQYKHKFTLAKYLPHKYGMHILKILYFKSFALNFTCEMTRWRNERNFPTLTWHKSHLLVSTFAVVLSTFPTSSRYLWNARRMKYCQVFVAFEFLSSVLFPIYVRKTLDKVINTATTRNH